MQVEARHPMNIMPATKLCKSFTETGTFGADAFRSDAATADAQAAMAAARVQREAVRVAQLDGSPQDKDPAPGKVWLENGEQCFFEGQAQYPNSLTFCQPKGDSTIYAAVNHLQDPKRELVAFCEQSNLEFGGPPTRFTGFSIDLEKKTYYQETMQWK